MSYTPYLISNFASGLNKRLQPWLILDDAQEELLDGDVYRGTMTTRDGYVYFANGLKGGAPYRESRIVHTLAAVPALQVPNGAIVTFTLAGTGPIARGSVTVNGSSPLVVGTDNGLGLIGAITGTGIVSGTVNYTTGALSVTFAVAPAGASTVTFTYSFMPGNPVMMIATYVNSINVKELIVADTQYVNRYNPTFNILEDITVTPYTGNKFEFFAWTNYASPTYTPRLIFSNNRNIIQQYDGTVVSAYAYNMETSDDPPVPVTALTCAFLFEFKDRLLLLRTTENTVVYPQRIRISGTGANSDDFRISATGAGFIDIPDGTWIQGAAFSRDDLLIFTEASTWSLRYTGNDTKPFTLTKIDESRGCDAGFSVITYLNRTSAASKRGLIISDGYRVERQDMELPDFTFNEVDNSNFDLCFAGTVDDVRDHYLLYPPPGQGTSRRILVTNYDEDNYAIYRLPLSCMGTFKTNATVTWADLLVYPTWAAMAAVYNTWDAFPFAPEVPVSLGGGHKGEIWQLGVTESEDNPVNIYNITAIDTTTIEVTTDWNNYSINDEDPTLSRDNIFLTGIVGMEELNNHQFPLSGAFISNNVFRLNISTLLIPATSLTAYVSGGRAQRVIPFSTTFKQFNPFIDQDKKVRCGWLYMYVNTSGTQLRRNIAIQDITTSNPAIITTVVDHNLSTGNQVNVFLAGGMTEINGIQAFITVIDKLSFSLNGIDSSLFTPYTSGGYVSAPENAKLEIQILTNDRKNNDVTQLNNPNPVPYQGNMTNLVFEDGVKKWYKVFINQTGKFIQFKFKNEQAGATVNIQGVMPGFQPLGRLI